MTPEVKELVEAVRAFVTNYDNYIESDSAELPDHTDMRHALHVLDHAQKRALERTTSPVMPSEPLDLGSIPREELEAFYARHRQEFNH